MKCANCGKEFGNGVNCQNCGVDRVTGLGNYSGYDKPSGSRNYNVNNSPQHISSSSGASNTMICYACGEIIPVNSEFCPYCSKQLYVTCPKCGETYSSQFPACNKCGTNRETYLKQIETERKDAYIKEQERLRKQRKQEQAERARKEEELRIKNEVYKLRGEFAKKSNKYNFIWGMLFFLFMLLVLLYDQTIKEIIINQSTAFLLIIGCVCVFGVGLIIINGIEEYNIEKWKREHPNDPRSKYL